jgi:hypothetical protein
MGKKKFFFFKFLILGFLKEKFRKMHDNIIDI